VIAVAKLTSWLLVVFSHHIRGFSAEHYSTEHADAKDVDPSLSEVEQVRVEK
jgi:hypothetical protein